MEIIQYQYRAWDEEYPHIVDEVLTDIVDPIAFHPSEKKEDEQENHPKQGSWEREMNQVQ